VSEPPFDNLPEPPEPEVCPECNGEGITFTDRWGPRREHYTLEHPCPACAPRVAPDEREELELGATDTVEPGRAEP
jgi:DnaJ-class molecular chaperone